MTADARRLCEDLRAAIVRTGWSRTAALAGVDRCNLHRAFSGRLKGGQLPNFNTITAVAHATGLEIVVRPKGAASVAGASTPTAGGC